ncbi:MAG TPA: phosphatidate cytidylyltransferase [Candidatus Marinimicrobia bacterium]|nr:phosphatidate cytidylyltransferase [Candidatus Neomarinimicrobiota bacterium]HRS51591.1 phosphatidate cytidylyltransferase [Candidatus Neomarinimicrobiota bacterium]HRU92331.1 phosphatidate cytidylyltransferase [Candidatus Neomarinimicrobiota bacterium]
MNNFASRMLINVIGIPAILLLIQLGRVPFVLFITVLVFIAQVELYLLMQKKGTDPLLLPGVLAGVIWLFTSFYRPDGLFYLLIGLVTLLFLAGLLRQIKGVMVDLASTLLGFVYLPMLTSTIILMRNIPDVGRAIVFLLFVTIWICDSLAFVFGKWLGRHKIAPQISPNKTYAGCIAGLFGAVLTVLIFYFLGWAPDFMNLVQLIIFGLLAGVFGQAGDFVESLFKRDAEVKDSSNLLLGHGGVLDRFDSIFIGAPVIFLYIVLIL